MKKIYMDHMAANPLHPEVLDAMLPYLKENFSNPLSLYEDGIKAREAIERARESTAKLVNAKAKEIIFTSSGAESNNFALKGIAFALQSLRMFERQLQTKQF
jgi:cysteine desulfurase